MAVLTVQQLTRRDGLAPADLDTAAAGGDTFDNTAGDVMLFILNEEGSPIDVEVTITATVDGQPVDPYAVTIPDGDWVLLGPYPPATFNDEDGLVTIEYTGVTTDTSILAFRAASAAEEEP